MNLSAADLHAVNLSGSAAGPSPEEWMTPPTSPEEWVIRQEIPAWAHLTLTVYLSVVGTAGCIGNAIVLYVFLRYLQLRSQETTFIANMAASDLICSLLHFMTVYSSSQHRWTFSKLGCELYAAGVGLCGLVSIMTLACISLERCLVIRRGQNRLCLAGPLSRRRSRWFCLGIWVYCILLVMPPFFGWSSYIPEGFMTSCSWDYFDRSAANRSYYALLFSLGFVLPLVIIIIAYSSIIRQVTQHEREMKAITRSLRDAARGVPNSVSMRILRVVLLLVLLFCVAWMPYAAITLIGQFGPPRTLSQWVTTLPAVFAKTSVVFNPIVYGIAHKHFRRTVRRLIQRRSSSMGSSLPLAELFNSARRLRGSVGITSERSSSSVRRDSRLRVPRLRRLLITLNDSGGGVSTSTVRHKTTCDLDIDRSQWPRSASFIIQPAAEKTVTSWQSRTNSRPVQPKSANRWSEVIQSSSYSDGSSRLFSYHQ